MNREKNLTYLKENIPYLYNKLKEDTSNHTDEYQTVVAKKIPLPTIKKKVGEHWLPLHSLYNPVEEAERWTEQISQRFQKEPRHIIVVGFGFGYHVIELAKKYPNAHFHIYEPDRDVLLASIQEGDWSTFPWKQIDHFLITEERGDIQQFLQDTLPRIIENGDLLILPAYEKAYERKCKEFAQLFNDAKKDYLFSLTANFVFEKGWTYNAIRNVQEVMHTPSIFAMREQFEGRNVILTASGPSLEEAFPLIKRAQKEKNALIVAAGTSINVLMKNDMIPDVFFSYDPAVGNSVALRETALSSEVPLVFASTIYHQIPVDHNGPKSHFILSQDTVFPFLVSELDKQEIVPDMPTISAITLWILIKLGVQQIITAGLDLAYVQNKFYAAGASTFRDENVTEKEQKEKFRVESNSGEGVYSAENFVMMRKAVEHVIQVCEYKSIYNLSLQGAVIKGAPYITYEEAWNKICANDTEHKNIHMIGTGLQKASVTYQRLRDIVNTYEIKASMLRKAFSRLERSRQDPKTLRKLCKSIDKNLVAITHSEEFKALWQPLMRTRLQLMTQTLQGLNPDRLDDQFYYYKEHLPAFLEELQVAFLLYNDVLDERVGNHES